MLTMPEVFEIIVSGKIPFDKDKLIYLDKVKGADLSKYIDKKRVVLKTMEYEAIEVAEMWFSSDDVLLDDKIKVLQSLQNIEYNNDKLDTLVSGIDLKLVAVGDNSVFDKFIETFGTKMTASCSVSFQLEAFMKHIIKTDFKDFTTELFVSIIKKCGGIAVGLYHNYEFINMALAKKFDLSEALVWTVRNALDAHEYEIFGANEVYDDDAILEVKIRNYNKRFFDAQSRAIGIYKKFPKCIQEIHNLFFKAEKFDLCNLMLDAALGDIVN